MGVSAANGAGKRALDLALILAALPVLVPLGGAVWLALRLFQGSPALFQQRRAGLNGATFAMTKFRTMTDARGPDGDLLPDEARITPLGRFLRRSRLDELPEAWHVLSGEMALVGPRPLLPQTVASFGEVGLLRGTARPGVTGWAQVSGNTRLTGEEKLALDLWYVANRSAWLDLWVLVLTLRTALFGERVHPDRLARAREALASAPGAPAPTTAEGEACARS